MRYPFLEVRGFLSKYYVSFGVCYLPVYITIIILFDYYYFVYFFVVVLGVNR